MDVERQSTQDRPLCDRSKMYRIVPACEGVPADVGAVAAWPVYVNFPEARQSSADMGLSAP